MIIMEMTLFCKILWIVFVFGATDYATGWTESLPEKAEKTIHALFGLATVLFILSVALLPFINLLWK